jgi:hypothetical protein
MQLLSGGRYVANVVDGKVNVYGKREGTRRWAGRRSAIMDGQTLRNWRVAGRNHRANL